MIQTIKATFRDWRKPTSIFSIYPEIEKLASANGLEILHVRRCRDGSGYEADCCEKEDSVSKEMYAKLFPEPKCKEETK